MEVVTGVSDGDKVEIVSGLEEGQTVWYIAYESAEAALLLRRRRTGECLIPHRPPSGGAKLRPRKPF